MPPTLLLQIFLKRLLRAMQRCIVGCLCWSGFTHAASPDNMLVEAVRGGNLAEIQEALTAGARLNTPQGSTALMIALGDNLPAQHPGIVELLLERGADINLPDRRGMTPLLLALETVGDAKLLQAVLARGGDVRAVGREGQSAICAAAQRGDIGLAERLLEMGAPPDVPTNRGTTALMALAGGLEWDAYREAEYVGLAQKLIANGANLRRVDSLGRSAADLAFERGNLELLALLDVDGKYAARTAVMQGPAQARKLGCAIRAGKSEEVARLLSAGADPNGVSTHFRLSMLGLALQRNSPFAQKFDAKIVTLLLAKGAGANLPINDRELPLTAAASDPEMLALLLANGADVNAATGTDGCTALHRAAMSGAVESSELLLSKGARTEARSGQGFTPWLLAIAQGHHAVADLLSAKGADPAAKTAAGRDAADLAAANFDIDLLRRLDRAGKHVELLAKFSPPANSPVIGEWVATMQGRDMAMHLLPGGGGSIHLASERPLAWREANAGFQLVTTMPADERMPQSRTLEASVAFDAAAEILTLSLGPAMGERAMIFRRPGTAIPAEPPPQPAGDEANQKQRITTELARARMSNEPGVDFVEPSLRELPDELFRIVGLQSLMIQNTSIERLPGRLATLALLKRIAVMGNRLTQLDDEMFDLPNLDALDLSRNRLKTISNRVTSLAGLIELNLYDNRLVSLPEGWEKMPKLRSVIVADNWLQALPVSLARAPALDFLNAGGNVLSTLPDELAQAQRLTSLSLNQNRFTEFPKAIGKLRSLEYLDLSQNDLSDLAADLSGLTGLRRLVLSGNRLAAIPTAVQATRIEELDLSGNKIKSLPADSSALPPTLRVLDLADNEITEVPEWVASIGLRDLRLRGNPMPEEKIRAWEQRIRDQRKRK